MGLSLQNRHKVPGCFLVLLLLSQFCTAVLAANKGGEYNRPTVAAACSQYGAFLKLARFEPSAEQKRAVESLFAQLRERHITIKPTLYKLLALTGSNQLVLLCKKAALFFSHVDNTCIKNSGGFSSMMRSKKHIRDFIFQNDADITQLAISPYLSSVTSMCNSKGVPSGVAVKNMLSWPLWQLNGEFNLRRFRSLSSMFHCKGLPKEADVKAILSWPCWQVKGQFNHELFRSFSSMFSGKGLPDQAIVNAILAWPVWQVNGQFNHELFRSFSSMFHGKGMPKETEVNAILSWPVWQVNGEFSYELFRSFSSMSSRKGLPQEQEVKALLSWPCWQVGGQFNHDFFRSFSSMFNGKGLPKERDVTAILSWPCWQVGNNFSYELFRSFSSMFHGKGIPKEIEVNAILSWPVWQVNGEFNHEFFYLLAPRISGRGLPKEQEVKAVLSWPCWQVNGEFSYELFRSIFSMFARKEMPNEQEVETLLSWPVWQVNGQFNCAIFRLFASMLHSRRGLPKECDVAACMEWLSQADGVDEETLQLMVSLFCGAFTGHRALGLPSPYHLRCYEKRLARLFDAPVTDAGRYPPKIKQITLFLANRGDTNDLRWSECERFFKTCSGPMPPKGSASKALALSRLHTVLLAHGGQGVRTFLDVNDEQGWVSSASEREQQLVLLSLPVPLELIVGAFDRVQPQLWLDYIYFGRRRACAPDGGQWYEICDWRRALPERVSNRCSQRDFIDMAVTLPDHCKKRLMTKEAVEAVITLFPSVHILRTLASHDSTAHVATLLCAALDYVQNKQYDAATLGTLLPALLHSGLTLPSTAPKALPYHTFTDSEPGDGGITIHCPVDVTDGETLLHAFVATFTAVASESLTTASGEYFTVEHSGGERFHFAVPKCEVGPHGFTIRNWSFADFKLFFDATETPEFYLAKPPWQDGQQPCVGSYRQGREAALAAAADDSFECPFEPLSLRTLALMIKKEAPIHRSVWLSFAHHGDKLPERLCQKLLPRALTAIEEVPVDFMGRLQSRYPSIPPRQSPGACSLTACLSTEEGLERLWAVLANKELLDGADLALLKSCCDQLSLEQLTFVVERASLALPADTLKFWRIRLTQARQQNTRRNHLLLDMDLDDDIHELTSQSSVTRS